MIACYLEMMNALMMAHHLGVEHEILLGKGLGLDDGCKLGKIILVAARVLHFGIHLELMKYSIEYD